MKVFITGASEGIGRELTKQLTKAGHQVWGIARKGELLKELQQEIGAKKFLFTVADVSDEKDVERVLDEMRQAKFLPDEVVLNAALFATDSYPSYNLELFKKAFEVNLFGALVWVEKFLPDFLRRGSGDFIAISSTAAYQPNPKSISLSASKSALAMAFRGLRLRYRKEKINFSAVYFGPVATKLAPQWLSDSGRPKYFFVLTPLKAASYIVKVIESKNKKSVYWPPFLLGQLFWILLALPDRLFIFLRHEK